MFITQVKGKIWKVGNSFLDKGLEYVGRRSIPRSHIKDKQTKNPPFVVVNTCYPGEERWRQAGPWDSKTVQSSLLCELQISEGPCLSPKSVAGT